MPPSLRSFCALGSHCERCRGIKIITHANPRCGAS
eukprot:XP_001705976.1 Hypothetical protein GL50803_35963 [Giardia lamblia ATCC 50803]